MFKLFAIVFAAILALASAAPKPGIVATYGAPVVAAAPAVAYSAPLAYSAPVAYSAPAIAATPLAYSGQINPLAYATYAL